MDIYSSLAVGRSVGVALTATGTTQATALVLKDALNELTTVAAGTGVSLPTLLLYPGTDLVTVMNRGANAVLVYPPMVPTNALNGNIAGTPVPSGMNIEAGAANAAVSVAAGSQASFNATSYTQIRQR